MKAKVLKAVLAASLATVATSALATEIRFDGFANFVAGQVLDKKQMILDNFYGYDDKLGFQNKSMFALQARADLKQGLTATAQVTAKGINDYQAKFNWAYLSYELNDEWTVKIGRSRIPYFMYSDFLDVGYAYHWISPPDSVYNLAGFDSADGVNVDYQTDIGNWTSRLSFMVGRSDTSLRLSSTSSAPTRISDLGLIAWSMNYDWLTLRAVYSQAQLSIDVSSVDTLAAGLSQFGVTQNAIDQMVVNKDPATFAGLGFSIDRGSYFLVSEYTQLKLAQGFLSDPSKQWYFSGGYRMKDFTFYGTYESQKVYVNDSGKNQILSELNQIQPFVPSGSLDAFNAVYGGVSKTFDPTKANSDTYSVGVRYNFHPSACAKLEYIYQDDKQNNVTPQAIALAIDLVY